MVIASGWIFLVGLANAVIGWGLWKQHEWGRIGALVLAGFRLLNIPLDTVIGGLTIWYLLREDVKEEFRPQPAAPELAAVQISPDLSEPPPAPPAPPQPPEADGSRLHASLRLRLVEVMHWSRCHHTKRARLGVGAVRYGASEEI